MDELSPLALAALIFAVLALLLLYAAYRAFRPRPHKAQPPAAMPPAAPAAVLTPAAPAATAPPPAHAPPAARHAPARHAPAPGVYNAPPARGVAYLTLDVTAHVYPLHALPCVIGCEPGCEVEVPDRFDKVSRRHAKIERSGNDYILADLGSTNGVWVNEARVGRNLLRDGTVFSLGKQVGCTFHLNP